MRIQRRSALEKLRQNVGLQLGLEALPELGIGNEPSAVSLAPKLPGGLELPEKVSELLLALGSLLARDGPRSRQGGLQALGSPREPLGSP